MNVACQQASLNCLNVCRLVQFTSLSNDVALTNRTLGSVVLQLLSRIKHVSF
jgi:hypothetical protein